MMSVLLGELQGTTWSSDLLRNEKPWTVSWNDPVFSAGPDGLRVEIADGKTWTLVAVPDVLFPPGSEAVQVTVAEKSPGGHWIVKLSQDAGDRTFDWQPFGLKPTSLHKKAQLNPWFRLKLDSPLKYVQLGLEGNPGDYVCFESLEVLVGKEDEKAKQSQEEIQPGQLFFPFLKELPRMPCPFEMKDWTKTARDYDTFVFDFKKKGQFLPLIWLDESRLPEGKVGFGLPSYVGADQKGSNHEGITTMGAILGATLCGIDKRKGPHDFVRMCEVYYNDPPHDLVLNRVGTRTGQSFWYEIWPNMVFDMIACSYPGHGDLEKILLSSAARWCEGIDALDEGSGVPNFDHTAFDFDTMKPVDNGRWREPDAAAGVAWMTYMAHVVSQEERFWDASLRCLRFLEKRAYNPYYEVLMPYGAILAARANAEKGTSLDVEKFFRWSFGLSHCRPGWGCVLGNWNSYDCGGLAGSATDYCGGYAFAMNSFAQAGALVPLVRYDTRFAYPVGRWMLNLANAAKLFYSDGLPPDLQSCSWWKGDSEGLIAHEGLRHTWEGKSPYAMGDPVVMNWGPKTDLGLYGSGYVGMLGALVKPTNVNGILQLDLLATDFFHGKAYPSFLYYNPHKRSKEVVLGVGKNSKDLYDAVSDRFLDRNVQGETSFQIDADHAIVLVLVPAKGTCHRGNRSVEIDGVTVRWVPQTSRG